MNNCAICGGSPEVPIFSGDGSFLKYLCNRCSQIPKQCGLCVYAQTCPFETDPSPLPKTVVKTIQQENMIAQVQIKNPSRIEVTCRSQCLCFSEEFGCLKENHICGNYVERNPEVSLKEQDTLPVEP